ncbi:uncharacterized protein LOC142233538 [Haematobia irritans]|uniref:uncharacterized protein LOC142233538 n=1 Tax=Haematobia irritans TaxID=7368 RepID=UPI003F4FF230
MYSEFKPKQIYAKEMALYKEMTLYKATFKQLTDDTCHVLHKLYQKYLEKVHLRYCENVENVDVMEDYRKQLQEILVEANLYLQASKYTDIRCVYVEKQAEKKKKKKKDKKVVEEEMTVKDMDEKLEEEMIVKEAEKNSLRRIWSR